MINFYIVRGIPGSGKSTTAKKLSQGAVNFHHFEADMYFMNQHGTYHFDASKLGEAHRWCLDQTSTWLHKYKAFGCGTVIVSNTFTTKKELVPYFELAKEVGVKPQVITCQGEFGSIHGVPPDKLEIMRNRFDYKCVEELFKEYF